MRAPVSRRGRFEFRDCVGVLLAIAASAFTNSTAAAQTCLGLPSFESGSVHLNVSTEFPDSAKAYALGLGAGKPNNLFANAGGGIVEFTGFTEKAKVGFLELGYQIPVAGFQVCPVVGGYLSVGPDDPVQGITVTSTVASFGAAVGRAVEAGTDLSLVPNVAAKFDHQSQKLTLDDQVNPIEEYNDSFDSSVLDLGLAILWKDRVSVQPLVHVPLSGDEKDPSFGVFLSFGFGWKSR